MNKIDLRNKINLYIREKIDLETGKVDPDDFRRKFERVHLSDIFYGDALNPAKSCNGGDYFKNAEIFAGLQDFSVKFHTSCEMQEDEIRRYATKEEAEEAARHYAFSFVSGETYQGISFCGIIFSPSEMERFRENFKIVSNIDEILPIIQ